MTVYLRTNDARNPIYSVGDGAGSGVTIEFQEDDNMTGNGYPYPIPDGVTIEWECEVRPDRQDACWYTGADAVATVRFGDRVVNVDRNGELRILAGEDCVIKDTQGLEDFGIADDAELWDRDDALHWEMNPWFDSYEVVGAESLHLDLVEYSAFDAVRAAVEFVTAPSGD